MHRNLKCQVHESRHIGSGQARVNVNILGIRELKWTGMGEFNSDDHYIHYCGQESFRRNGVAIMVKKESEIQYLEDKQLNITVIQVYDSTSNAEEAEVERFCDDLQDLL